METSQEFQPRMSNGSLKSMTPSVVVRRKGLSRELGMTIMVGVILLSYLVGTLPVFIARALDVQQVRRPYKAQPVKKWRI